MNASDGGRHGGFSLIELLVACVITALVVALVMRSFSAASLSWRYTEARANAYRDARAAIEIMSRDLRNVAPAFGSVKGDAMQGNPPTLLLDYDPDTVPEDRVNDEFYAMTIQPNAAQTSLCTVGYRCVWIPSLNCFSLHRRYKNGNATFASLLKAGAGKKLIGFSDLYFNTNDATSEDEVASCVWGFTIRPCVNGAPSPSYPRSGYSNNLPTWVDIQFKAMAEDNLAKLRRSGINRSTWFDQGSTFYKTLILPHQQAFAVRARLNAASTSTSAGGVSNLQGSVP